MSRYTYSTCKTVRAKCDPICPTEYDIDRFDKNLDRWMCLPGGWGNSKKGYFYAGHPRYAPTLRGLLDKIEEGE